MSEAKNDGGPAFPVAYGNGGRIEGMTLRDYLAAKAMQAYVARYVPGDSEAATTYDVDVAKWAYETADAMLKARGAA